MRVKTAELERVGTMTISNESVASEEVARIERGLPTRDGLAAQGEAAVRAVHNPPPLSTETRGTIITVRMFHAERERIKAEAAAAKMSTNQYCLARLGLLTTKQEGETDGPQIKTPTQAAG